MISKEKYIRKLKELAALPGNIEGIYNYCDRWCEKCMFTTKCLNFKIQDAAEFEKDIDNAGFWDNLQVIFEATRQMLEEDMERLGIKPQDVLQEFENMDDKAEEFKLSKKHPITIKAREMGISVMKWLDDVYKKKDKLEEMGIEPKENEPNIKNAIEVIAWYAIFISAKIQRAMAYFYDERENKTGKYDSDGSAKIALVAIDHSIEAWTLLYTQIPTEEGVILNYLIELSSIKEQTEALFPDARKFIRPGFDDIKMLK